MKKVSLTVCLAVGAAVLAAVAADPEIAWREALRTVVTTNGLVVATDTNEVTVAAAKTPAFRGQWLFGLAGTGTNGVWVAKGLTTNDWVQLKP
jgi:hypothetical protein